MAVVIALMSGGAVRAASISEVFFSDLHSSVTPNAIELDTLGTTGAAVVDLVVLDASPARAGQVLQVVSVPTAGGLVLVSDAAWPIGLWGEQVPPPTRVTLEELGEPVGTTWDFRFSRTLVLFDRATNLVGGRVPLSQQLANLNGAVAVDWLTFRRVSSAAAWSDESILDTDQGHVISQPYDFAGFALARQVGMVDGFGYLSGVSEDYAVTPGGLNPVIMTPEPGVAILLMGGLALFYTRRASMMHRYAR